MQNLEFNTGMIELAIQGDTNRVLRFNPSDSNVISGFLGILSKANDKLKDMTDRENRIVTDNIADIEKVKQKNQLDIELDLFLRSELDNIFGANTSDMVFGNISTTSITGNGDTVFMNFMIALLPFFENEMKKRNERVSKIIQDHNPKRK